MAQSILPNLRYFWFSGKVTISECKICINAPNLSKATIMLEKDWDRYTTSSFQASSCIRKFLANFSCCEKLQTVYVTDPEAPIFPDSMREELSPHHYLVSSILRYYPNALRNSSRIMA
ncbi:hypothetical protein ACFX2J_036488 [Malus domestica]